MIFYETHVRGYTKRHPQVPEAMRGTFAGLGQQEVIELHQEPRRDLGRAAADPHASSTTAISLDKGLTNYWGYNTIGFFAADPRFFAREPGVVAEFKEMMDAYARAPVSK